MNNSIIISLLMVLLVGGGVWYWLTPQPAPLPIKDNPNTNPSADTIKIIAFGDSLTAGFGVTASEAYPAQLEAALRSQGYAVEVINSGVSGETTRGNLERAEFIKSQNPDIVILGIGGNDALRQLPVIETKKNIRETISVLKSGTSTPIIALLQMQAPLNAGFKYKRDFDSIYTSVAKDEELILIPFLTAELFLDTSNKLQDGIHYNALGYQKAVTEHIAPAIRILLNDIKPNS